MDATLFSKLVDLLGAERVGARAALVRGDALEVLGAVPRGIVDVLVADPPYFLSNGGTTCRSGRRASVDKGAWDESRGADEDHAFHAAWLTRARDAVDDAGSLWVSGTRHCIFSIGFAMERLGLEVLNQVTWCKPNAPRNLGCRTFTEATETLLWASPRRRRPLRHHFAYAAMREQAGGVQMLDWWVIPAAPAKERAAGSHPAQKPVELYRRALAASSRPGALVLDPFAGSGTSGVAALELGRYWIGLEREAAHVATARARLRVVAQRPRP